MSLRRTALFILLPAVLASGCGFFETAAAVVNGNRIEREDFEATLRFLLADPRFAPSVAGEQGTAQRKDLTRQLLTFLIQAEIMQEFADEKDLAVTDRQVTRALQAQVAFIGGPEVFSAQLEGAEVTEEDARRLIRAQVLSQVVSEAVLAERLTPERLLAEYQARASEFTEVRVAHILVETLEEAEQIRAEATRENFADLAEASSLDLQSALQGGDLGSRRASEFVGPFADAILEIPVGEIGGPVQTEFGFHVIYVLERNQIPFEDASGQLVEDLQSTAFSEWLLERLQVSEIRVNPRYGAFDRQSGQVIERRATTPEPPEVQLEP
ncbi:MAG: peptidylprolyl isomerase [Actinomycetota bacterium]